MFLSDLVGERKKVCSGAHGKRFLFGRSLGKNSKHTYRRDLEVTSKEDGIIINPLIWDVKLRSCTLTTIVDFASPPFAVSTSIFHDCRTKNCIHDYLNMHK